MPDLPAHDHRRHVVLITHGIFSQGAWFDDLSKAIEAKGMEPQGLRYPTVYLFQFWLPEFIGRWIVPWFSRESALQHLLKQILAYPQDQYRVSIVAHSFGTWLVANILMRYPAVKLEKVVLLGCIVKDTFPWQDVIDRNVGKECVLNNYGTKDIWPLMANAVTWGYGPTGTFGIRQAHISDWGHNVGHSGMLTETMADDYIAPFLANETPETRESPKSHRFIAVLDFLKHTKWLVLALLLLWLTPRVSGAFTELIPSRAVDLDPVVFPEWRKYSDQTTLGSGEGSVQKTKVRLDKWQTYLNRGAQGWLLKEADGTQLLVPQSGDAVLAWTRIPLSGRRTDTFSYVFESSSQDIDIREVYGFLVHNADPNGYFPVYRQMKPTIDKSVREIEIRELQKGEELLCFMLVGSHDNRPVPIDPTTWGITLRRK